MVSLIVLVLAFVVAPAILARLATSFIVRHWRPSRVPDLSTIGGPVEGTSLDCGDFTGGC
jgi:hypothetical protein